MNNKKNWFKIETIKDGKTWYALKRVINETEITGLYTWVKQGRTKQEAVNTLKIALNIN